MKTNDIITSAIKRISSLWLRLKGPLELLIFPILLALWPFVNIFQGVDIADTTYSLTNYTYIDGLDPMWLLATWLPNMVGYRFTQLPGGGSMAGMNAYCAAVIAATALVAYFGMGGLRARDGASDRGRELFPAVLRFVGLFIAESLCWCPGVILYNYLTYFFVTLASVFLLSAFSAPITGKKESLRLWLAGNCLGMNIFVRFPNAVEALFIIAVIFFGVEDARLKADVPQREFTLPDGRILVTRPMKPHIEAILLTIQCVGGYITGVIAASGVVLSRYGLSSYLDMIRDLFSMTEGASDYTAAGMLGAVLAAYATTFRELLLAVPVIATGYVIFFLTERTPRLKWPGRLVFSALLAVLLFWYYRTGVFTRNYQYYDSMFELAMMALIGAIVLCCVCVTRRFGLPPFFRAAALLSLLIILITPLGSNNYTFPAVNNLFIVLPVTLTLLYRAFARAKEGPDGSKLLWQREAHLIWQLPAVGLLILLTVQASLFHLNFAFGDGTDGSKRDTTVYSVPRAHGMRTTAENAEMLSELYVELHTTFKEETAVAGHSAIIFGNAPGLHYLMGLRPALFTAWPDLDSNAAERIGAALNDISASDERPLVIFKENGAESENIGEKTALLLDYMEKNGYNKLFDVKSDGDAYNIAVYAAEGGE